MKKLIWITFVITIICNSCDYEDKGPYIIRKYEIINNLNENLQLLFYRDSTQFDQVRIQKQSRELLLETSYDGFYGPLINEPYNYDSIHYINDSNVIIARMHLTHIAACFMQELDF